MTIPREVRARFYTLRALGFIVGLSGTVAIVLGAHSFGLRSLGLAGIVIALWIVRRSNACVWAARGQTVGKWSPARAARRVGHLAWILTVASLVACIIFYLAMYEDGLRGGKEVWPVYAFLAAVMALALTSGYVAAKLFR